MCAYDFKPDTINLITGAKQTGCTSFVNIIDYVFGASDCDLPDTFNPSTELVGVVVSTERSRYVFVRAVPAVGRKTSEACDFVEIPRSGAIRLPSGFALRYKPEDIRWQLDRIVCGDFGGGKRTKPSGGQAETDETPRLTFRDVFNFSLQDDTTIADRHCLVKGISDGGGGLAAKMKPYFPFILGIIDRSIVLLENEKRRLEKDLKSIADERQKAARARQFLAAQREVFEMLGAIRNAAETWERLSGEGSSEDALKDIRHRIADLELKIAERRAGEERSAAECRRFISHRIQERLKTLFVKADLPELKADFDIERFTLHFLDGKKARHFSNVGASSNYICFHMSVSCAFMEQFGLRADSPVQNFVIFDCPALEDGLAENGEPLHYVEQLIGTLTESESDIREDKGKPWQPILMLQTPVSPYHESEQLHIVAHFNEGSGIIPNDWLS